MNQLTLVKKHGSCVTYKSRLPKNPVTLAPGIYQVYSYPGNVLMKLIICLIDDFYTSNQPKLSDTKSKKQWSNVYKRTPILLWEIKNFKRAKYFLNDTIFSDLKELGWYNAYWWRSLHRKDDNLIWNIHSVGKRFVYFSFKTLHNFSCIYYNRSWSFF